MKVCILMLIHKDVESVNRLINKIKHPNMDIYIHVDKKSNMDITKIDKSVHLLKTRKKVYFADYTQLFAVLECLKEIKKNKKYDRYIFLSGQDYPIVSSDEIFSFFKKNKDSEFIDYKELGSNAWNVAYRYEKIFFKNRYMRFLIRKIPLKLSFINNWQAYGGDSWFNITDKAVEILLKHYSDRNFRRRIKLMEMPEEIIFQSVILNSELKNNVINNSLRYIDWSEHAAGLNPGHPNILTEKDFDKIINSNKLFFRKTDPIISKKLMQMLDDKILEK